MGVKLTAKFLQLSGSAPHLHSFVQVRPSLAHGHLRVAQLPSQWQGGGTILEDKTGIF